MLRGDHAWQPSAGFVAGSCRATFEVLRPIQQPGGLQLFLAAGLAVGHRQKAESQAEHPGEPRGGQFQLGHEICVHWLPALLHRGRERRLECDRRPEQRRCELGYHALASQGS